VTAVRFTSSGHDYRVGFVYDPAVVALLKSTVPAYARSWTAARKEWAVENSWADVLAAALRAAGHTVVGIEKRQRQRRAPRDPEPAQWAWILFQRVGPSRRRAVYRALAKVLHPDTPTGDTALQRELNDAHARAQSGTGEPRL
jgi:hypothetical protein